MYYSNNKNYDELGTLISNTAVGTAVVFLFCGFIKIPTELAMNIPINQLSEGIDKTTKIFLICSALWQS